MHNQMEGRILALLSSEASPSGLGVAEIARKVGKSVPFTSQTLQRMGRERLVVSESVPIREGRTVRYRLAGWLDVTWSSPAEGVVVHWRSFGEVDWHFPLVSQIPDYDARTTLWRVLTDLEKIGALRPRSSPRMRGVKIHKADYRGITVVVHGSAARGTARKESDVDVVVFCQEPRPDVMERIHSTIDEASLNSPRPIQLALLQWGGDFDRIPLALGQSLQESGLIVFDGLRQHHGAPGTGFWKFVYGGRKNILD